MGVVIDKPTGHLEKSQDPAQFRNVSRWNQIFQRVQMLLRQTNSCSIHFETKKLCFGEAKTRFMYVEGDVVVHADLEKFFEIIQKGRQIIMISEPVVDIISDVGEFCRSLPIWTLSFRTGIFLSKWQNSWLQQAYGGPDGKGFS